MFDQHGKVKGGFATVVDVSADRSLEADLRQKAEQLLQADRKKDEFLATLAHDHHLIKPVDLTVLTKLLAGLDPRKSDQEWTSARRRPEGVVRPGNLRHEPP